MQHLHEIKVSEISKPQAKDGEAIVQIAAADVNFVDLLYVRYFSI
jgi:NADPH:quinone reductase-like Zn-dependent oxidoreductase